MTVVTKIDIISGFLGAGKTTLIKKLLSEAFQNEKVVLIENEFGEIAVSYTHLSKLQVADIYKTSVCPLAKVMRRELKQRGVRHLKVVYSTEEPVVKLRTPGRDVYKRQS